VLYRLFWLVGLLLCRTIWRTRVEGLDRLPIGVPYVVAPVHRSYVDFIVVGVAVRRLCRFMVKGTVWRSSLAGRLATYVGSFPVDRDHADRAALRTAEQAVLGGDPIVMFPEGRRKDGPLVEDLFDGPVGLVGTERAMPIDRPRIRPARIRVVIGEPIYPDVEISGRVRRRVVTEGTEHLRAALQELCLTGARELD
jgi:1-acyl-sn-glycerol-3-phosphate acyltransferase